MTIEIATKVGPARIDIAYERFGDRTAPPVLLIMGLGAQLIVWPDAFCDQLVGRGLQVIRFDNRDAGQSTHFKQAPFPNIPAVMGGDRSTAPYTLSDMAADTVSLLDTLGIERAHLVGASMGGFIAQTVAIEHPARVLSLTSIMSSTGDRTVGQAQPAAMSIFTASPATSREEAIQRALEASKLIGSPGFPFEPERVAAVAGRAYDRGFDPAGIVRQAAAVIASGDRTPRLRDLRVPTLVIHGLADPLVDPSGGRATAAAIPGARLVEIDGMGHSIPLPLVPRLVDEIAAHVSR